MTNTLAIIAANMVLTLTQQWITSPEYPTHDYDSGIGQGICVEYCGSQSNAPSRSCGIVVSRIITDKTKVVGGGERWCLVEFGDGPPWKGYALTNLITVACSRALKDFPKAGMVTVRSMLGIEETE